MILPATFTGLEKKPQRIVSLVPSQTEFLFDLGLNDSVVGITKFCIYPKDLCKKTPKIGGTKNFNISKIVGLQPDLIIGNKEENYQEGIEILANQFPIWLSDIYTLADALQALAVIGELVHKPQEANRICVQISEAFDRLPSLRYKPKVAYLIWNNPIMVAGNKTFIHHLLEKAGFENAFAHLDRYPMLLPLDLQSATLDYVFLSSEPYPFKVKHQKYFEQLCPQVQICIVDGELFSWYGTRLLKSVQYFKDLRQMLGLI